jgi:hypothetical protein
MAQSAEKKGDIAKEMGLHALVIIGSAAPVPLFLGDAVGAWVLTISLSGAWNDTRTSTFDKACPAVPMCRWSRIWLGSRDEARRLMIEVPRTLGPLTTRLRADWLKRNPDVTIADIEDVIINQAEAMSLQVYTDDEVRSLVSDQPSTPDKSEAAAIN